MRKVDLPAMPEGMNNESMLAAFVSLIEGLDLTTNKHPPIFLLEAHGNELVFLGSEESDMDECMRHLAQYKGLLPLVRWCVALSLADDDDKPLTMAYVEDHQMIAAGISDVNANISREELIVTMNDWRTLFKRHFLDLTCTTH